MFDDFISQFRLINAALNSVGSLGIGYLILRGYKHWKGYGRAALMFVIIVAVYFLSFALTRGDEVAYRYYHPIVPFLLMLSAMGFYCLGRDIGKMRAFYIGFGVLIALFITYSSFGALRESRRPQTEAGKWLAQYDPDYRGPVASDYSQPVAFTKMGYFPTERNERLFRQLAHGEDAPLPFKYIIVEDTDDPDYVWAQEYVKEHEWRLIYPNEEHPWNERGLQIYENPNYPE